MSRKVLFAVALATTCLAGSQARAQGFDMSLVYQNMQFDNQFNQWSWAESCRLARQIPNDQPVGNPLALSRSINQWNDAFDGSVRQWHDNSNRTHAALQRWSDAYRGYGDFQGQYGGPVYQLPHQYNQYYIGPYGQAYPGPAPAGMGQNLYMR